MIEPFGLLLLIINLTAAQVRAALHAARHRSSVFDAAFIFTCRPGKCQVAAASRLGALIAQDFGYAASTCL